MQIIIELTAKDETTAEQQRSQEISSLSHLMDKLHKDGYKINSLYGNFIFDKNKKEVIDCGQPGTYLNAPFIQYANSIFQTNGKLAIIFTDKKYMVFANSYFVAIHFCHRRKVRPLSINDVLKNYDELLKNENKELLGELYLKKFNFYSENKEKTNSSF